MRILKATLLGLFCSSMVFGQVTTMNVYQSNGVLLQIPVSAIDSVTLSTAPPPSMSIYQTGGSVSTIVVANIDSITYTVGGNPLPPGYSCFYQPERIRKPALWIKLCKGTSWAPDQPEPCS